MLNQIKPKIKCILSFVFLLHFGQIQSEPFLETEDFTHYSEASFRSPTERQIEYESVEHIMSTLQRKGIFWNKYWPFWKTIAAHEEKGIFGYHAAKQELRIFHDIVKTIFEEILGFEIKKDFYFFRVPLDPDIYDFSSAQDFLTAFSHIHDGIPVQRDQIISLNYSLFGNYRDDSQCTVLYFSRNHSWFKIDYTQRLSFLFNALGIPVKEINPLFTAGSKFMHNSTGVIYQFFDTSHHAHCTSQAYAFTDTHCYPALGGGKKDSNVVENISNLFQGIQAKKFDTGSGQLRLIMNCLYTLNPYSTLTIRRYDLLNEDIVTDYEKDLKAKIQKLSFDPEKVKIYKNKLEAYWYDHN